MKKKTIILKVIGGLFLLIIISIIGVIVFYNVNLKAVNGNAKDNEVFTIKSGTPTSTIISSLKEKGLIRNEFVLKIYSKLHPGIPQAGRYIFTTAMSADEIYNAIINGDVTNDTVWVTFVEGKRLSYIKSQIASSFGYTEEEVDAVMEDREFIKELIDKYDILTEDILKEGIYHPLEGYLFADTYEFMSDVSIKEIIEKMVSTLDSKVSVYESEINNSKLSVHEIMTLASIIELEGARSDDRTGVAGVFYNRLNAGWSLGSDVTTYYAVGKDFSEDLKMSELNSCNGYNTRGTCVKGLPIGPIASPSIESIVAAIEPKTHDYYYFVADKNGKTYFSKTDAEHNSTVNRLKAEGLWYTYE